MALGRRDRGRPPMVKVHLASTQALVTATVTTIIFDTVDFDTHSIYDGTSTFTIPKGWGGVWGLSAGIRFATGGTGYRQAKILTAGGTVAIATQEESGPGGPGGGVARMTLYTPHAMAVGDNLILQGLHTQGANLNVGAAATVDTFMCATFLGPL